MVEIGVVPQGYMAQLPHIFTPLHCKSVRGTLYGNIRTHENIPEFADMAMRGELMLDRLITRKFRLEEINDVAEAMKNRQIVGRWVCEWN